MADEPGKPPIEEDVREDDLEFDPTIEPKEAKAWLNLIEESEDAFEDWHDHCDRIDKQYASLERLSALARDKEFQMFWANAEVIKPSIYAKPPVPVVVPKFKDRRPVYQAASELMERCAVVAFDLADIDELMKLVRDDLALVDRGAAWVRYESGRGDSYYDHEKVCIDFKNRRDFLHSISRNWREVTWVAGASYLTRAEARQRFYKHSGNAYQDAEYKVDKDSAEVGGADNRERACFWEIWDRANKRVCWVAKGCEKILDEDDPHLKLRNYFPCPKPAYGTVQRGSLVPVPDVLQYKDQLEEINMLTGRIHALSDAIEAKGFYPAGGAELSDAIQAAIQTKTPGRLLVPISNWAAFGGSKEIIIWLPIDMISQTITALVMLRKQVIDDIYQIMGLSDIMRGATDPQETLGAQELKTQYGSTRIRDKQQELVRFARDLVEITSEVITEKFSKQTMIEMSQTQLPTNAMVQQAIEDLQGQLQQLQSQIQVMSQSPQAQQMAQAPPDPATQPGPDPAQQAQQAAQLQLQQLTDQIRQTQQTPTIEQVFYFLKDNRAKAFTLDIETDSTIMADENGEKQRRTEFVGVLSQLLPQLAQMISTEPTTADFCGQVLKFSTAPYRTGRSLDGAIDELVEQMKQKGQQPQNQDPATLQNQTALQIEQMKDATAKQKIQTEAQLRAQELQMQDQHKQMELANERSIQMAKLQSQAGDQQAEMARTNQELMQSREEHQQQMIKSQQDMALQQQKADLAMRQHAAKATALAAQSQQRAQMQQFRMAQPRQGPVP